MVALALIVSYNIMKLPLSVKFNNKHNIRSYKNNHHRSTFVSAYIRMKSKHSVEEYDKWMDNFMALDDPVIIFTTPDMFDTIRKKRTNGADMILYSIFDYVKYDNEFWEEQWVLDPEKRIHTNPLLYFVWSIKTKLVYESTLLNPFNSEYFVWSDIGCYRNGEYRGTSQLKNIPNLGINTLFVNIFPYKSGEYFYDDCDGSKDCRRIAGAQFICKRHECANVYEWYSDTVKRYRYEDKFIGNDQNIMATMCIDHPCQMFTPDERYGDPWFGIQGVMAGKYLPKSFKVKPSKRKLKSVFKGRLGNQLFQLQAGLYFAKKHDMEYCISNDFEYGHIVDVSHIQTCENFPNVYRVPEKHYGIFNDNLEFKGSQYNVLDGYFQSWKYNYKLTLKKPPPPKYTDVGIHVRVGDKAGQSWFKFPPDQYFIDSIGNTSSVVVVTDDKKFCQNHPVLSKYKIMSESVFQDFNTLMGCNKIVSTLQSTFSWWASKLAKSKFVYYENEIDMSHRIQKGNIKKNDYYLPNSISWKPKAKPLYIVLGVPHSGTSLLAGILELSGMKGESMSRVDKYHPKGIFESQIVNNHNDWLLNNMDKPTEILISKTKQVLEKLSHVDIIKKPQIVDTLHIWEKAADREIIKLISYRHPVDACNHPNCPNCGPKKCFENIIDALKPIYKDSIVFDMAKFQNDYYGTYLKLIAEIDYDFTPMSKIQLLEFISPRQDTQPELIIGDNTVYGVVTQELLDIHKYLTGYKKSSDVTTSVVGLWDLNRPDRSIADYKKWLYKSIEYTDHPVVLFTDEKDVLERYRNHDRVTTVHVHLRNMPMFRRHFEKNKQLHNDYKSDRVENKIPEYNVVQWIKFDVMRIAAAMNIYNSTNILWIDAGISRFGKEFNIKNNRIKEIVKDKFLISIHHHFDMDKTIYSICTNTREYIREENSHLAGTILVSSVNSIELAYDELDKFLYKTTDVNNDQVILAALYCESDALAIIQTVKYYHPGLDIQHVYNSESEPFKLHNRKRKKYAIATMLVSADDKNYIKGSLKLAKSIKQNVELHNVDMILLEIIERPIPRSVKRELEDEGWIIKSVHKISPHDEKNTFPRFRDQFTKLQLWGMTEYERIVYLDSDTLVVKDISELFTMPMDRDTSIVASRDIGDGKWRSTFNMGMFMIQPNKEERDRLIIDKDIVHFETAMSEQGFLNVVYKDKWKDPGFIYNANIAVFSQIPNFWKEKENQIKVIHYTMEKPWSCSKAYKPVCTIWDNY